MFDLVTAGEAFDDLVFHGLTELPPAGREVKTSAFARSAGGGAIITSVGAARLGLRCAAISGLTAGAVRLLRDEGVSVHNVRREGEPAALTVALSTRRDRHFVTFKGMNDRLPERIRRLLPRLRARHVHFALHPGTCRPWLATIAALRRRGTTSSWDFGWHPSLIQDAHFDALADAVDYLLLNRDEALFYARARTLAGALRHWRQLSHPVLVKLAAGGSRAIGGGVDLRAAATRIRVVDTTGAGDAFNAGFLAAVLHGRDLRAALRLGNRVGALSARSTGGIAGLPRS